MDLLQRMHLPSRLAARVWLLTVPSAVLSFERRQHVPAMPIGRARLIGLPLIAAGLAVLLRFRRAGDGEETPARGPARLRARPAVAGALLALGGAGLFLRSLMLTAYAFGLTFAFVRDAVDLEEPQLPGRAAGDGSWEYDETHV